MRDSWLGMPPERHRKYGDRIAPMHDGSRRNPTPVAFPLWAGTTESCALCRPGGSPWGPIRELGYFYEAMLAGGIRGGVRVVSPQTVNVITARHTIAMLDRTFNLKLDRGLGVVLDSRAYGQASGWYGSHCSSRTFGHAGYMSSLGFADPENALVVTLVFNGLLEPAAKDARMPHKRSTQSTPTWASAELGAGAGLVAHCGERLVFEIVKRAKSVFPAGSNGLQYFRPKRSEPKHLHGRKYPAPQTHHHRRARRCGLLRANGSR